MHIPFKRLYAIVVVKCKVNPEYFLDSMTNYELNALLEYANELNKEEWERLRMQCFYSVIPHTTDRKLTPEKVMPFYWDNINKKAGTKINIDNDKNRIDELLKKTE